MPRVKSKKYTGVYLNHLENGDISYSIIYKDGNKTRRFTIGKKSADITETFAYNKRNEFINKLHLGIDPIAHKKKKQIRTLNNLAKIYFDDKSSENKSNKKQNGRYDLHIKDMLGDKDIYSITKDDIKKLQKNLSDKNKAPKTINGIITLLKAIINYSIKEKELNLVNPALGIKNLKTDDKRERFLSIDEVKLLIESVRDDRLLYHFVKMALSTGARLESVLNIKKKDIDLVHNKITIKDLKNGSTYTGFFSDDKYIEEVRESIANIGVNDYYVGGKATFSPSRTIQRRLKPILDRLFNSELDVRDTKNRVVIHTLRHTFASQLVISGVPIFTVKNLMNHGTIEMTMRYAKLAPDSGSMAVKGLYG
jgi:integrase